MAGCALGYPIVDGRLQRNFTAQILFTGVFSILAVRFFSITPLLVRFTACQHSILIYETLLSAK